MRGTFLPSVSPSPLILTLCCRLGALPRTQCLHQSLYGMWVASCSSLSFYVGPLGALLVLTSPASSSSCSSSALLGSRSTRGFVSTTPALGARSCVSVSSSMPSPNASSPRHSFSCVAVSPKWPKPFAVADSPLGLTAFMPCRPAHEKGAVPTS